MSGFVCEECDESETTALARFCKQCSRTHIAGYTCDKCGHQDVDPEGQEWGHKPHKEEQGCRECGNDVGPYDGLCLDCLEAGAA